MAATTRRRTLPGPSGPVPRPLYPSGRFHAPPPPPSSASSFASSSSSTFASRASATSFFRRSASPTRVDLHSPAQPSPSIRFALDRPTSPSRSISVSQQRRGGGGGGGGQLVRSSGQKPAPRRTCMCSPTTHPGSFRCSLHKGCGSPSASAGAGYAPNRLNARRSAMTNSLVRIGGVEGGDLVRRALAALIRPSSHQQRRRSAFQPRPSRLSVMSKAAAEERS